MKNKKENYVTQASFNKEVMGLHKKIDSIAGSLDQKIDESSGHLNQKIDRVALSLVNTQEDVRQIKEAINTRMATKDDIQTILSTIDAFVKKNSEIDQEQTVQGMHLQETRRTVANHETRITQLEAPR